jgi:phosphoserine aminotransferase
MSLPYDRVFNFSAGPSCLPVEVLEEARDDLVNYKGAGMSVMEMSHRGKVFEGILAQAEADLRELLAIPPSYRVLFLQGGASLQFTMIPMSFMNGGTASYVVTGTWGQKAVEAARMVGDVRVVFDAKSTNYDHAPRLDDLTFDPETRYAHMTSNETIQGVDFLADFHLSIPVVCDMSSNILSRPVDISKYDLIYAGAQKNMGPAGVTVVIISEAFLERAPEKTHPMLDYRLLNANDSMYNTPPCWAIYVCGLVYQYLRRTGGLAAMQKRNEEKAQVLYGAIDGSGGFYRGHAQPGSRSLMNVTFTLATDALTDEFVKEAKAVGLDGLKGHRSVGGCRASIYNAFPIEGCHALADFMRDFASRKA